MGQLLFSCVTQQVDGQKRVWLLILTDEFQTRISMEITPRSVEI